MAFKLRSQWTSLFTRMFSVENGKYELFFSNKINKGFLVDKKKKNYTHYLSLLSTYTGNKMMCTIYCYKTLYMGPDQSSTGFRYYSLNKRSVLKVKEIKNPQIFQQVFKDKKHRLKQAELKIRKSGKMILEDIKETKVKMKERMGEIIEVKKRLIILKCCIYVILLH